MQDADDEQTRLALCREGLSNHEIAKRVGKTTSAIRQWRRSRGLPSKNVTPRTTAAQNAKRQRLYDAGWGDVAIAREVGVDRSSIEGWRRARGLASRNRRPLSAREKHPKPADEALGPRPVRYALRQLRYALAWSDADIARAEGIGRPVITAWRKSRGLDRNVPQGGVSGVRKRAPERAVLDLVRKKVGRHLAVDIADDAVSEMMIDILSGNLPLNEVDARAQRYGSKLLGQYANRFGPRSLDEMIGSDGDFRLIDTIRDESADTWLEEMGATVW